MPGLPKVPSADSIDVGATARSSGCSKSTLPDGESEHREGRRAHSRPFHSAPLALLGTSLALRGGWRHLQVIGLKSSNTRKFAMIKFYYSGAPNPTKVALFLEEAGLPYEAIPVDTRKGEQHKPEFLAINPNAKVPAIVDGDATVFEFQRDPALSRREDRQIHAGEDRQGARRNAVVDDVRRVRRRPVFGPVGAFPQLRAGEDRPTRSTATRTRRSATSASSTSVSAKQKYMLGDTYTIVDMAVWGWARLIPIRARRERAWRNSRTSSVWSMRSAPVRPRHARCAQGQAHVQDRDGRRSAASHVPAPQGKGGLKPPPDGL